MKRSITRWTTTLATAALLGVPAAGMAQTPAPQQPPTQQQPPAQQPPAEQQPPAQQPPAEQPPTPQPPAQQPPPAEQPPAQPPAEPPAQTPPTTQPPTQQPPAEQPPMTPSPAPQSPTMSQGNSEPTVSPQEHLRQAKAALDGIPATAVTGRARTQLAELKRHMTALDRAASPAGSTTAPRGTSGRAAANATVNWGTEVAAIDKILGELTAAGTATGTGSIAGTTGSGSSKPTGTAGSKAAAAVAIDDATRATLMEVRTHIVGFATGMSAPQASPKGTEASMAGDAPAATAAATPSTAGTLDPRSNATGAATTQAAAAANAPQSAAAPQVDQDAVRRHLTAARDTLAEITKLPAAAQLQGENRAQVSQLIANFNELITTQSNWSASYAKVDANLNALLGGVATDTAASAAMPSPSPAPTSPDPAAAPGAVGTSGMAKADLDPAIRAKLIQLRSNLDEFHKAAGPAK